MTAPTDRKQDPMLILKLTVDEVTAHGIEPDLESSLTVTTRDVLADGVEALCPDVLRYLGAEATEPAEVAAEVARVDDVGGGQLDALTPRELARLRMTVDNEDVRDRAGRFDPVASADDLAIVLPILRKLLATHTS
jgi:hypothetical protein